MLAYIGSHAMRLVVDCEVVPSWASLDEPAPQSTLYAHKKALNGKMLHLASVWDGGLLT